MLKLGKDTGSMTNHLYSRANAGIEPTVGLGCTILEWTDRHAATIYEVKKMGAGDVIMVREDISVRTDDRGMCDDQSYEYTPNASGKITHFRFKNGKWNEVVLNTMTRRWNNVVPGKGIVLGLRDSYHDYSF